MKELLKIRSFVLVWFAQGASGLGHTFSTFIISWLVYEMTGSKMAMGGVFMVFMLPNLAVQIWVGPFLDRLEKRKLMMISQWTRALAYLVPVILLPLGLLEVWHLYALKIVSGATEPLFRPSSMAYIAELLPPRLLMKGNSVLEGTMQVLMLSGPALGGLIVSLIGPHMVLICLVATLTLAGGVLCLVPARMAATAGENKAWIQQFKEGLSFFRIYPVLLWVGMLLLVTNFTTGAIQPMYLPFVTESLGGDAFHYGLFTSSLPLGKVLASLWLSWQGEPYNRRLVMLGALFCSGVFKFSLALVQSYPLALVAATGIGFSGMLFTVNNTTFYQKRVPNRLRGRVFSVRILMAQTGVPLGAGLGGILGEQLGVRFLFASMGMLVLAAITLALLSPVFFRLNDHEVASEENSVNRLSA